MAPPLKSALRVGLASILLATMSGNVLGFQALKHILLAEGAYGCTPDDVSCAPAHAQYIVSLTLLNLASIPASWFTRRRPVLTSVVGCVLDALGFLMMGLAARGYWDPLYFIGFQMLAFGGAFCLFAFLPYCTSFPGWENPPWSTLVSSMLIAMFEFSAMLFQVWKWLYEIHGVSLEKLCYISICLPAAYLLFVPWLYADTIPHASARPSERDALVGGNVESGDSDGDEIKPAEKSTLSVWRGLMNDPLVRMLAFWSGAMMTCKYWWYDNVQKFMEWRLGDVDQAENLYDGFNIAIPLSSGALIFTTPLFHWSLPGSLVVMGVLSATVGALTAASVFALQGINMGIVLFNRYFFFTALTTVSLHVFKGEEGGAVFSFALSVGTVTSLLALALDALARWNNDMYWLHAPLNITAGCICACVAYMVHKREKENHEQKQQQQPNGRSDVINVEPEGCAAASPAASGSATAPPAPEG